MLNWNWKNKIGELDIVSYGKKFTVNLYRCNGLIAMIYEFDDEGVEKYTMYNFWSDKSHMMNCLGLSKGYKENIHDNQFIELRMIHCKEQEVIYSAISKAYWSNDITLRIIKSAI